MVMPHALDGIQEKLERANENILNLEREIAAFLQDGTYPVIPNDELGAFQEAIESHTNRIIPRRFGILRDGAELDSHTAVRLTSWAGLGSDWVARSCCGFRLAAI